MSSRIVRVEVGPSEVGALRWDADQLETGLGFDVFVLVADARYRDFAVDGWTMGPRGENLAAQESAYVREPRPGPSP